MSFFTIQEAINENMSNKKMYKQSSAVISQPA